MPADTLQGDADGTPAKENAMRTVKAAAVQLSPVLYSREGTVDKGNLIYFHEVDKGGHFAAWEQPELFATELRAAFKSLREAQ
jgi:pimeloyl-ACP methyl ester carboxylesterase